MPSAIDRHLAQLLMNYLSTAAAVTAGLPAVAACPRILAHTMTNDVTSVQLTVTPQIDEDPSTPTVTLTCAIQGLLSASVTADQLSTWQSSLCTLLKDATAFYEHLAALDDETWRTGWRLLHYGRPMLQPIEHDLEARIQTLPVVLRLRVLHD